MCHAHINHIKYTKIRDPNMSQDTPKKFKPISIAVLTISDSRTDETDKSGHYLKEAVTADNHNFIKRQIVTNDVYQVRAVLSDWVADDTIQAIITSGGTGLSYLDVTPEAVKPLLDKEIEGFGELFRALSYQDIETATIKSRAFAGIANGTTIFCLPGSKGACEDAWTKIISHQLNILTKPCNLVKIMHRMTE